MAKAVDEDIDMVACGFHHQLPDFSWRDEIEMEEISIRGKENLKKLASSFIPAFGNKPLNYSACKAVYRRSLVPRFYSERELLSEDLPFNVKFLLGAESYAYLPVAAYNYNYRPSSISHSYDEKIMPKKIKTAALLDEICSGTIGNVGARFLFCMTHNWLVNEILPRKVRYKGKYQLVKSIITDVVFQNVIHSSDIYCTGKTSWHRKMAFKLMRKKFVGLYYLYAKLDCLKNS